MTIFRSTIAVALLLLAANAANADSLSPTMSQPPTMSSTVSQSMPNSSADGVSGRLQVHVPQTLFRAGGYDHREALFGTPPYGISITQNVYYADSDLCDPTVNTRKGFPIRAKDKSGNMEAWPTPYILMVDRGGCSFVQKVRNAQKTGAAGVIIADNTCLCSDKDCVSANRQDACQPAEPIMADDGSGGDISIPSVLMFKVDADEIIAELRANHMVQVEMQWALHKPDNRVEYDLWTTPSDLVSKDFQKKFKPIAQALGDRAYFTPHMYIYDGIKSNCQGFDGENMCFNLCTNNGRYCFTRPDNDLDHGISGADVVKESLRRICIWRHYGEPDGVGTEWWDYVAQFMDRCDNTDYFASDNCVKECYKHASIEGDIIEHCISDSGGLDKDQANALLDFEMQAQVKRGVVILPIVFVNSVALRGGLSVDSVFTAVCNGYFEGTEPEICKECDGCDNFDQCIAEKKCENNVDSVIGFGHGHDQSHNGDRSSIHDLIEAECDAVNCETLNCNVTIEELEIQVKATKEEILDQIIQCACCTDVTIVDLLGRDEGASRKSIPVGISSEEYSTFIDGEAAHEDDVSSQKKYFPFLVAGLVIAAAVLLTLVFKYRRLGENPVRSHSTSNNNSGKDYATLSVQMAEFA